MGPLPYGPTVYLQCGNHPAIPTHTIFLTLHHHYVSCCNPKRLTLRSHDNRKKLFNTPYASWHRIDVHQSTCANFWPYWSASTQNNTQVPYPNFSHLAMLYTSCSFAALIGSLCIIFLIAPYIHHHPHFTFVPCFISFHHLVSLTLHPEPELCDPDQSSIPRLSSI